MSWTNELSPIIQSQGFEHFAWVPIQPALSLAHYRQWLDQGCHGEMTYLERHLPLKENPELLLKNVHSALVVLIPYFPPPQENPVKGLRIAYYAQHPDYHDWILKKLNPLVQLMQRQLPDQSFLAATDSKPILERDLAARAGLGWIGKNTCLIRRDQGSLFFIAEILTTMPLPQAELQLSQDHCGKCNRCVEACPTGAITDARWLDARRCISYLTIEAKSVPSLELRPKMGDWFFGCDICQTVCPWNEKVFGSSLKQEPHDPQQLKDELEKFLTANESELTLMLQNSPLKRAGRRGLRRNALIVAANLGLKELKPLIETIDDLEPDLEELRQWCLETIESP